ncbi:MULTISPECIES: aldose 1-epimerase [unclassified Streptomyces]|uniref:aldose epimerase family protein n=1 Tax=unclassified Streptomyces TaxID=2593676 RepID=UPI002E33052C|nr:aldose 1-epimerase [Streptomyces sp. NBC_01268]
MSTLTRLTAGDAELTIDPEHGCRIDGLRIGGTELLLQGERYGAFVMAPWAGRTENGRFRNGGTVHQLPVSEHAAPHALHGTVRDVAWKTARVTDTTAAFTTDLADPWPYPGRVTQTFELTEDSLTLQLGIEATEGSFPAQAGWHPWFHRNLGGQDVELDFTPGWQEERGEDHLPTGRRIEPTPRPWDDCFGMPGGVDITLTWPEQLELRLTSRAEWLVIYDEPADAVCVEPQSGPPNGLNTLPRLVTPIDPLEVGTTWRWRRL